MTRQQLQKRALRLSYFTVGYNLLEGLASVAAGSVAGSIALVGFGLDSFIESLSGGVMIWRFRGSTALSELESERMERTALKLVGYTFLILGAYVLYESASDLYLAERPDTSMAGIVIVSLSLIVMPLLFRAKYRTGQSLGSSSLVADSKQTLACVLLSIGVLAGLALHAGFGLWQADPVIGLCVALLLFTEGWKTLRKGELCSC